MTQLRKKDVKLNQLIRDMVARGIPLTAEERELVGRYLSPHATERGQHFTPPEMAEFLVEQIALPYPERGGPALQVLEPSCGVGNLLVPFYDDWRYRITAYETDAALAPLADAVCDENMTVHSRDVFEGWDALGGAFDLVVMNPPFNNEWGQKVAMRVPALRPLTTSGHRFLGLALHALRPGGQLLTIGTYNYVERLTKAGRAWFEQRARVEGSWKLPGTINGISVHGYSIVRLAEPQPVLSPLAGRLAHSAQIDLFADGLLTYCGQYSTLF